MKKTLKINKKEVWTFIIKLAIVALAGLVGGISFNSFFASMDPPIIPTGMSGLAMLINTWIGGGLSTSIIYLILNVILFALSLKFFGWKFLVLSGVGLGTYVLGMEFGHIEAIASNTSDLLLYCIVGSIIGGLCVGLAMRMGGSTGGSDVFGALTNRAFPKIKTGYAILAFNVVVLILSIITTKSLDTGLYALVNSIVSSLATDMVLDNSKKIVAYYIICDKPKEISEAILTQYHRGVTKIDGTGMFTGNEKSILLCLVPYDQSYKMREFVLAIDPKAFVFSSPITQTIGEHNLMTGPLTKDAVEKAINQTQEIALPVEAENKTEANPEEKEEKVVVRKTNKPLQKSTTKTNSGKKASTKPTQKKAPSQQKSTTKTTKTTKTKNAE